ncbi:MAG TPA: DNA primase [Candidatus Caldiarchaeum subterraneum]|uniref:DNA primase DnaG n=1 Tax=Caldiarchaeum subterraneum TaxID=311458 RepID=A0A832ZWE8_CALS0|nr:DNA primase [Aigarchaeota archaeon]HIQ30113.1 DNA primase [Candidatus Caldarchaeum subterraneum]
MSSTVKYVIEAKVEVDGPVDRNDIVGAIFGQTEGIFSSELDLRELQKTGRIGRIEITVNQHGNKATGRILVPTSLDKFSTALVAAMIESIDRVGPYHARVTIEKIEDTRAEKRKKIVERAKEILASWEKEKIPEEDTILKELEEAIVKTKVIEYGPDRIPAGPEVDSSDEIIVVEGRADVINLLRFGYKNTIAVEGVKIPKSVQDITRRKRRVIAFLDGDRGGDLILKELLQTCKIDLVARAPHGREVEELTAKEIAEALSHAVTPEEEIMQRLHAAEAGRIVDEMPEQVKRYTQELEGTLMALLLNKELQEIARIPVSELVDKLAEEKQRVKYVVFDGLITQRVVDALSDAGEEVYLIGVKVVDVKNKPENIKILTLHELAG